MIPLIRLGNPTQRPPLFPIPGINDTISRFQPIMTRLAEKHAVRVADHNNENNAGGTKRRNCRDMQKKASSVIITKEGIV
jgi:hypothetical protein